MVSEGHGDPETASDMGSASSRPVCIRNKSQGGSFLHMDFQSIGFSNRRIVNCMGKHGSICVSPNMSHSESHSTHEEFQVSIDPDSTPVAEEAMVHKSASNVHCISKKIASSTRSFDSAQNGNMSSKSADFLTGCMATVNRFLQNKGFSVDTRKRMVASWRSGTRKDYAVKFNRFSSWCSERNIDPQCCNCDRLCRFSDKFVS